MLFGMRIGNECGSVSCECRAKIRTLEASQPQHSCRDFRIGTAQHFKLQICNYLREWNWRIVDEVSGSGPATLFAAETDKVDCAAWTFAGSQRARKLQHRNAAGSVVVSAVEDLVVA